MFIKDNQTSFIAVASCRTKVRLKYRCRLLFKSKLTVELNVSYFGLVKVSVIKKLNYKLKYKSVVS